MNCKDFETLLADAVGDELTQQDRSAFTAHLSQCETCRREFESLSRTVQRLRSLPGPSRLIAGAADDRAWSDRAAQRTGRRLRWLTGGAFRFAAGILIAFVAGYGSHAALMIGVPLPPGRPIMQQDDQAPHLAARRSLRQALADAHQKNPVRSDMAKCLAAMFSTSR